MPLSNDVSPVKTQFELTNEAIKKGKEHGFGLLLLRLFFSTLSFTFKSFDKALYPYIMPITALIGSFWFYLNYLEASTTRNINFNLLAKLISNLGLAVLGVVGVALYFGLGISSIFLMSVASTAFYAFKAISKLGLAVVYGYRYFKAYPGTERRKECKDRAVRYMKSGFSSLTSAVVSGIIGTFCVFGGPVAWGVLAAAFFVKAAVNFTNARDEFASEESPVKKMLNQLSHIQDDDLSKTFVQKIVDKQITLLENKKKYLDKLAKTAVDSSEPITIRTLSRFRLFVYSWFPQQQEESITLLKRLKQQLVEKNPPCISLEFPQGLDKKSDTYRVFQVVQNIMPTIARPMTLDKTEENKPEAENNAAIVSEVKSLDKIEEKPSKIEKTTQILKPLIFSDTMMESMHMMDDAKLRQKFLLMLIDKKIGQLEKSRAFVLHKTKKIAFLNDLKKALVPPNEIGSTSACLSLLKDEPESQSNPTLSSMPHSEVIKQVRELILGFQKEKPKHNVKQVFFVAKKRISDVALLCKAAEYHICYGTVEVHKPGSKYGLFYLPDIQRSLETMSNPDDKRKFMIDLIKQKIQSYNNQPNGRERHKQDALIWCRDWLEGDRAPLDYKFKYDSKEHCYSALGIEEWLINIRKHPSYEREIFESKLESIGEVDALIRLVADFNKKNPKKDVEPLSIDNSISQCNTPVIAKAVSEEDEVLSSGEAANDPIINDDISAVSNILVSAQ